MRAASDRREEPGRFITDGGGTEILQRVRQVSVRFIPARAGNNIASPSPVITPAVYPRSAGNSRIASHNSFNKSVYPRSRGEQEVSWYLFTGACGLSPLARGTEPEPGDLAVKSRFIPARAGNSARDVVSGKILAVYPRSRGEQVVEDAASSDSSGLSPLARGTETARLMPATVKRFIPARAGNRIILINTFLMKAVYPRSRGEQHSGFTRFFLVIGLSPLARGTD